MKTIKINEIDVQYTKKGKNGWHTATVSYTDESNGKDFSKKLQSFKNPKVFGVIQEASVGDRFDVEDKKEGDFWEWVTIQPASANAEPVRAKGAAPAAAGATKKGDWETSEERARRQVYIVKQSSIAAAINLLGPSGTVEEVLSVAQKFVDYVFEDDDEEVGTLDSED